MKRWIVLFALLICSQVNAEQRGEIYRLRGSYYQATRQNYPELYRQLSAAPFVHTLPVQLLIDKPAEARERATHFDQTLYERILRHALNPPKMPPSEEVLSPSWPLLAWKVARTMEWTHVLHDQLIDILADDSVKDKQGELQKAISYYLNDPLAITPKPLKVELLSDFPYSHEYHHAFPRIMGIMMAYHWLQGAQYEAMLAPSDQRGQHVRQALTHFRELLSNPPNHFPLTYKSAPTFYQLAPEAGYIFDNLHILHHIAQDILLSDKIVEKRSELYRILPLFLNRTASTENFASGPQEEPLMPGALGHQEHEHQK